MTGVKILIAVDDVGVTFLEFIVTGFARITFGERSNPNICIHSPYAFKPVKF